MEGKCMSRETMKREKGKHEKIQGIRDKGGVKSEVLGRRDG
jgi:hypothetical protein